MGGLRGGVIMDILYALSLIGGYLTAVDIITNLFKCKESSTWNTVVELSKVIIVVLLMIVVIHGVLI